MNPAIPPPFSSTRKDPPTQFASLFPAHLQKQQMPVQDPQACCCAVAGLADSFHATHERFVDPTCQMLGIQAFLQNAIDLIIEVMKLRPYFPQLHSRSVRLPSQKCKARDVRAPCKCESVSFGFAQDLAVGVTEVNVFPHGPCNY